MHPKGTRKCRHCGDFFVPDVRNRNRQRYCAKAPCRKACKAASQRRWLSKPENADYFKSEPNATRARNWQAAHPGYWKRRQLDRGVLQELLVVKAAGQQRLTNQDAKSLLQDAFATQDPILVGLISHLAGTVLQDDIAEIFRRLSERGTTVRHSGTPDFRAKTDGE